MKTFVALFLVTCLTACGTAGGLVSGMGTDLTKAGEWIKSR